MPTNAFGYNSSSNDNGNKNDTTLFVKKTHLKRNYIESNTEEDKDLKNQIRIKNLSDPISIREAASKNYVDTKFNEPGIIKNTSDIDLNDKTIANVRFIEVNHLPEFGYQLTTNLYVDIVIRISVDEFIVEIRSRSKMKIR